MYTKEIMSLEGIFEDASGIPDFITVPMVMSYILNRHESTPLSYDDTTHEIMEQLFLYGSDDKSYCPKYLFVEYYNRTRRSLGSASCWMEFKERYTVNRMCMLHRNGYRYRGYEGELFN